eukprot:6347413-Amphidinium_carterae.1
MAKLLAKTVIVARAVIAKSSVGSEFVLEPHPAWVELGRRGDLSVCGATLDLRAAYKQMPIKSPRRGCRPLWSQDRMGTT